MLQSEPEGDHPCPKNQRLDGDDDDRIVRDGERLTVPMSMLDSRARATLQELHRRYPPRPQQGVVDAMGQPIIGGGRPGFRFLTPLTAPQVLDRLQQLRDAAEDAREARIRATADAWKGPPAPPSAPESHRRAPDLPQERRDASRTTRSAPAAPNASTRLPAADGEGFKSVESREAWEQARQRAKEAWR